MEKFKVTMYYQYGEHFLVEADNPREAYDKILNGIRYDGIGGNNKYFIGTAGAAVIPLDKNGEEDYGNAKVYDVH